MLLDVRPSYCHSHRSHHRDTPEERTTLSETIPHNSQSHQCSGTQLNKPANKTMLVHITLH